jgi:hypothetical protein
MRHITKLQSTLCLCVISISCSATLLQSIGQSQ